MEQNGIPFLAVVLENTLGILMLILASIALLRYIRRKSKISAYLTSGLYFYAFAAMIAGVGKFRDYYSDVPREESSAVDFTITIAYVLLTLSNIFFALILSELFLKKGNQFPLFLTIVNSIIAGLIIPQISFEFGLYDQILPYLVLFIIFTMITHGVLAFNAFQERSKSEEKLVRVGFLMMAIFSLLVIFSLLLFIADLVVGILQETGFTPFYYAAWITVGVSSVFAFLGYLMPSWFKNLIVSE